MTHPRNSIHLKSSDYFGLANGVAKSSADADVSDTDAVEFTDELLALTQLILANIKPKNVLQL